MRHLGLQTNNQGEIVTKTVSPKIIQEMIIKIRNEGKDFKIPPGANLFDYGIMDSFSVMQLVQNLESEFDIVFDFDDLRRDYFSTVDNICDLLVLKHGLKKIS